MADLLEEGLVHKLIASGVVVLASLTRLPAAEDLLAGHQMAETAAEPDRGGWNTMVHGYAPASPLKP